LKVREVTGREMRTGKRREVSQESKINAGSAGFLLQIDFKIQLSI